MLKNHDCPALKIGGTSDYAHLLFRLSKNLALADVVEKVKTGSSKWPKNQAGTLQSFYWQNGYGGFSVSPAEVDGRVYRRAGRTSPGGGFPGRISEVSEGIQDGI